MTKIIAHRGLRCSHPENTLPALQAAIEAGVWGVEFDVALTADFEPLLLHQETLEPDRDRRALKLAERDWERRWLYDWSASDVRALDAGSWMNKMFSSARVPHFEEALSLRWNGTRPCIELIDPHHWSERSLWHERKIIDTCCALMKMLTVPFSVISFNEHLLLKVRDYFPHAGLIWGIWTDKEQLKDEVLARAHSFSFAALTIADQMIHRDPSWIADTQSAGLEAWVYEVSPTIGEDSLYARGYKHLLPEWDAWLALGVDGIETDFAVELAAHIKESYPAGA